MQTTFYKSNNILIGSLLYLFAYFNIALVAVLVKALPSEIHVGTIIFFQFFIPLLLSLPFIWQRGWTILKTKQYPGHLLRDVSGIATFSLFFLSLSYISLTQAIVLRSTAPFWIPLVLLIWRKEMISKSIWIAVMMGFSGIILIIKPSINGYFSIGSLFALGAGFFIAISTLTLRELAATEPTRRTLFYYCLFASLISLPFLDVNMPPGKLTLYALISIGVLMFVIESALITALTYEKASSLAPVSYSAILFSCLFDWLFFNKTLTLLDLCGAFLIISAGILTIRAQRKKERALATGASLL